MGEKQKGPAQILSERGDWAVRTLRPGVVRLSPKESYMLAMPTDK